MQGLLLLYEHTSRRVQWKRLVDEIMPDFIDPTNDGPLPGREGGWNNVTHYRVLLAMEARQWEEATHLQKLSVAWSQQLAAPALAAPPETLDAMQRRIIGALAVARHELGRIQKEQDRPECLANFEEALSLYQRIGDNANEAVVAFNLGNVYLDRRDFDQAEDWYLRILNLCDEHDRFGRGKGYFSLGQVARRRFLEALIAGKSEDEVSPFLNKALQFYSQALDLFPLDAVSDLATVHGNLGIVHERSGNLKRALKHFHEAIRCRVGGGAPQR